MLQSKVLGQSVIGKHGLDGSDVGRRVLLVNHLRFVIVVTITDRLAELLVHALRFHIAAGLNVGNSHVHLLHGLLSDGIRGKSRLLVLLAGLANLLLLVIMSFLILSLEP